MKPDFDSKIRFFGFAFLTVFFLSACTLPYSRDISSVKPLSLKYHIPKGSGKQTQTPFTVAFVNPRYAASIQVEYQSLIALQGMPFQQSLWYRKADFAKPLYLGEALKALQTDMDQILLAKGIRTMGPFKSWDEMTFDNKKRAIYTLEPEVIIKVGINGQSMTSLGYHEEGMVTISGGASLILRESITTEKLWVKRFELEPVSKPYKLGVKSQYPRGQADIVFTGAIKEEDTSDIALNEALGAFYEKWQRGFD